MTTTIKKHAEKLGIHEIQGYYKGDKCIAILRDNKYTIWETQDRDITDFYSLLLEPMGISCYLDAEGRTSLVFEDGTKLIINTSFTWVVPKAIR